MNMETVTAIGDHGSITFRKSDGVVVSRDFDSGYKNDPNAGYPFILWANPETLTQDPTDILRVGYYYKDKNGLISYEPPIEPEELTADPLPTPEKPMKPFDLEQAKAGAPVITRNGCTARIICFDRADDDGYSLVALLQLDKGIERVTTHTDQGRYCKEPGNNYDLFMGHIETDAERQQRLREEWCSKALDSAGILSGMKCYDLKRLGEYIGSIHDALLSGELKMPEVQK